MQLLKESTPRAAKEHRCSWCGESIPVGSIYRRVTHASSNDGFQDHKYHPECESACVDYCSKSWMGIFDKGEGKRPI